MSASRFLRTSSLAFVVSLLGSAHAQARGCAEPLPKHLGDELAFRDSGNRGLRGVTIGPIESALHPNRGYGSPAFERTLAEVQKMGATWVSLTPFGRVLDLA